MVARVLRAAESVSTLVRVSHWPCTVAESGPDNPCLTPDTTQHLSVLAFRGTEGDDPTDLATDATALLTQWENGGRVHQGFAHALLDTWPIIQPLLESVEQTLLFTGHSLGAALATLAASKHRPTGVYTFV